MSKYDAAMQSGVRGQSYPGQFNRLFPGANNVISYYTGAAGPSTWTSSIGLYGRYVLSLHASIQFDESRTRIVSYGSPTFVLDEYSKIDIRPNENPYIHINRVTIFSEDSWARLVDAKGDFHVLGLVLETNKPVEGFEGNWRSR